MTKRTLANMSNGNAFSIICIFLIMLFNWIFIPQCSNILIDSIKCV